jgi:hypothetical protein
MPTAADYAEWIVKNQNKAGTPEFSTVAQAYQMALAEEQGAAPDVEKQRAQEAARTVGANLSPTAQGALTFGQGATFNFLDELAGAAALGQMGQSYALGGTDRPPTIADYTAPRDVIRGGTAEFAERNPNLALGLEVAGGLATLPLSLGGSVAPLGAGVVSRGSRYIAPVAGQSAVGATGASEAETGSDLATDILYGTVTGTLLGGGTGLGIKGVSSGVRRMLPSTQRDFQLDPARERLAQLLQRDLYARMPPETIAKQDRILELEQLLSQQAGPTRARAQLEQELAALRSGIEADPTQVAAARLQRPRGGGLGPEAPIASTGAAVRGELALLQNEPGAAQGMIERATAPLINRRGNRLQAASDEILDAQGVPFRATVDQYNQQAKAQAAPFYAQLQDYMVDVDPELVTLLNRASDTFKTAERLARVEGMPEALNLGRLQPGDRVPFNVLDTLKRTLYDIEDKAKTKFGQPTQESRAYTNLRRDLTSKLDKISPTDNQGQSIYRLARERFGSETQMATAMERGRKVMTEDVEELAEIIDDLEPAQLEAFRIGAAQALRDKAATPNGQAQLMNLQKSPGMQKRLRLVFGNDFRRFQATVLREAELQKTARAGQVSQTYRLFKGEEDQNRLAQALQATQMMQGDLLAGAAAVAAKDKGKKLTERQKQQLAELLLLRGDPAQDELRNVRLYLERRAAAQRRAQEASGRIGAFGAGYGADIE